MKNLLTILAVVLFLTSCKEEAHVTTEETPTVEEVVVDTTATEVPSVEATPAPAQ